MDSNWQDLLFSRVSRFAAYPSTLAQEEQANRFPEAVVHVRLYSGSSDLYRQECKALAPLPDAPATGSAPALWLCGRVGREALERPRTFRYSGKLSSDLGLAHPFVTLC